MCCLILSSGLERRSENFQQKIFVSRCPERTSPTGRVRLAGESWRRSSSSALGLGPAKVQGYPCTGTSARTGLQRIYQSSRQNPNKPRKNVGFCLPLKYIPDVRGIADESENNGDCADDVFNSHDGCSIAFLPSHLCIGLNKCQEFRNLPDRKLRRGGDSRASPGRGDMRIQKATK